MAVSLKRVSLKEPYKQLPGGGVHLRRVGDLTVDSMIRGTMLKNIIIIKMVPAQLIQLLHGLVTKNFEPENSRS
jgi:hypothetical protein